MNSSNTRVQIWACMFKNISMYIFSYHVIKTVTVMLKQFFRQAVFVIFVCQNFAILMMNVLMVMDVMTAPSVKRSVIDFV